MIVSDVLNVSGICRESGCVQVTKCHDAPEVQALTNPPFSPGTETTVAAMVTAEATTSDPGGHHVTKMASGVFPSAMTVHMSL